MEKSLPLAAENCVDSIYTAITEDGSLSLVSGEYSELYHNKAGAYSEALLSYARVAFAAWNVIYKGAPPASINLLDCCFGLGYNSFALIQESPPGTDLAIIAIEKDPRVIALLPRILSQPCFKQLVAAGLDGMRAEELIKAGQIDIELLGRAGALSLRLVEGCLRSYLAGSPGQRANLDLIVHDPFSPKKMPELWTIDLFQAYKQRLKPGGIILTYSSAPAVRGALQDLGFYVYRTPAQGGKSCGTLAILGDQLENAVHDGSLGDQVMLLEEEEIRRLGKSSRVPFRDPGLVSARGDIIDARLEEQKHFRAMK